MGLRYPWVAERLGVARAGVQRALGQEELNVRHQCGHALEDLVRQVQADVTAELGRLREASHAAALNQEQLAIAAAADAAGLRAVLADALTGGDEERFGRRRRVLRAH